MAKVVFLAAALAVLLLMANTSASDERQERQCREQIKKQDKLRCCQRHVMSRIQGDVLKMRGISNRDDLDECCGKLRDLDDECQCQALQYVSQKQERWLSSGQERRQLEKEIDRLQDKCDLNIEEDCDFSSRD